MSPGRKPRAGRRRRLPPDPPRGTVGVPEPEQVLELRVRRVGVLERVSRVARGERPGQPAKAVGREVEARCRRRRLDRRQRVARGQEHHEPEGAGVVAALAPGAPHDGAEAVPEPEEQGTDGVDAHLGPPPEHRRHFAPGREEEVQQLGPGLGIRAAGDILDQESEEAVPAVQEGLPLLDLRAGQRPLGGGRDGWRRGQVEGDAEPDGVRLDGQLARPECLERRGQASGGCAERSEEGPDLLDGRPEVEAEGFQLGRAPVPDDGPEPRGHGRGLAGRVVEAEVDVPEPDLPVMTELGPRQDLRVTGPGDGPEAPAQEGKPGGRRGGPGDPEPLVGGLEDGIADDERAAAVGRPPELERAAALLAEMLPHGGAQDLVVDGQRERDLDRRHLRGRHEGAHQGRDRGDQEEAEPPDPGRLSIPCGT